MSFMLPHIRDNNISINYIPSIPVWEITMVPTSLPLLSFFPPPHKLNGGGVGWLAQGHMWMGASHILRVTSWTFKSKFAPSWTDLMNGWVCVQVSIQLVLKSWTWGVRSYNLGQPSSALCRPRHRLELPSALMVGLADGLWLEDTWRAPGRLI